MSGEEEKKEKEEQETRTINRMSDDEAQKQRLHANLKKGRSCGISQVLRRNRHEGLIVKTEGAQDA